MVNQNNTGYDFDSRLARRLKRRCMANQRFKLSSYGNAAMKTVKKDLEKEDIIDEDYQWFLNSLPENAGSDEDTNDDNHDDGDIEALDPHYKMFLDHYREDGKSYVLEITINKKLSVYRYEREDDCSDERSKHWQEKVSTGTTKSLRSASITGKIESPDSLNEVLNMKKTEKPKVPRSVSRTERPNLLGTVSSMQNSEDHRVLTKVSVRGSKRRREISGQIPCKGIQSLPMEKTEKVEPAEPISRRLTRSSRKGPSSGVPSSVKGLCGYDSESVIMEECYKIFLNSLKQDGDSLVFTPANVRPVKYENDNEEDDTSDSEVVAMDIDPCCGQNHTPFMSSKAFVDLDNEECREGPDKNNSPFRERLMEDLKRPCNLDEYKSLLKEVTHRREIFRDRELRSGLKPCKVDSLGLSYLDVHNEFATEFYSAQHDAPRVLTLLRGFFYWLQNLTQEGCFQPWLDPSCLKVLP